MSFYWTPYCDTCDERGPRLRSGMSPHLRILVNEASNEHVDSSEPLKRWLDDHEYHSVQLLGEGQKPRREIER